jgi:uncharacterized protein (DUF2236 family)
MQLDDVRTWVAGRVRYSVVGPGEHAAQRRIELFETPGERWFEPDSPIHRVHRDSSMFVGGLRAILLQSLHPHAMAGVAQHSDYRHDPWGRLQRTADFLAATTFGPVDQAKSAVARVRAVHEHVAGIADDGQRYEANDPHLLRWVHIVEVDSFLAANRRHGAQPLDRADADQYVAQMAVIATEFGIPEPPHSVLDLHHQIQSYRPELRATREARQAARFLLLQPPVRGVARPVYGVIAANAVALLPRWARAPLRLPWMPMTEKLTVQPAGQMLTSGLRWALASERK